MLLCASPLRLVLNMLLVSKQMSGAVFNFPLPLNLLHLLFLPPSLLPSNPRVLYLSNRSHAALLSLYLFVRPTDLAACLPLDLCANAKNQGNARRS